MRCRGTHRFSATPEWGGAWLFERAGMFTVWNMQMVRMAVATSLWAVWLLKIVVDGIWCMLVTKSMQAILLLCNSAEAYCRRRGRRMV